MENAEELALVGAFYLYGDMTIEQIRGRVNLGPDLKPLLELTRKGVVRMYWVRPWAPRKRKMMWGLKLQDKPFTCISKEGSRDA